MANLTQGLQGVIPNVNIRLLDGRPTQAPRINIRGNTSIGQGGNALVLIDGVEGDPSMREPERRRVDLGAEGRRGGGGLRRARRVRRAAHHDEEADARRVRDHLRDQVRAAHADRAGRAT